MRDAKITSLLLANISHTVIRHTERIAIVAPLPEVAAADARAHTTDA
jgi:hypothetical protein